MHKKFYKINQVAKNLIKDNYYVIMNNSLIISASMNTSEPSKIVSLQFSKPNKILDKFNKSYLVDGKKIYYIYKDKVTDIEIEDEIYFTTEKDIVRYKDKKKLKNKILNKYKRFPQFNSKLFYSIDFSEQALGIFTNKLLYTNTINGVYININKKMLNGFKKPTKASPDGSPVTLNIYSTMNTDYLFVLELVIYRKELDCYISNKYLIINY